jgi:signal transduction histidine kinase
VKDAVKSIQQGAYSYLEKPVDTKELELHIIRAMEKGAMEQRLTQERCTWERVAESMRAVLVLLNSDRTVVWMNSIAQDLYKVEDFSQGQLCTEIIPQDSLPCAHCPAKVALSSGKTQSVEHHNPTTGRWFLVTAIPIQDLQGNIVQAAELALDITEIKQAQDILLKQERLKGVFEMAGSAAHELSQPMQSILGWGELLKNRVSENDPNFKTLRSICQEIEKLGDLITKISNVTRYVTMDYPGNSNIIDLDKASTERK